MRAWHRLVTQQAINALTIQEQVEKKEFPPEEDYCVQLHVVDDNLECSFFGGGVSDALG